MKKIISMFLAILMVVTMVPVTVFAENGIPEEKNNTYIVRFEANGENVENMPSPQFIEEGNYASVPFIPRREGYYFMGWYLDVHETSIEKMFDFEGTSIYEDTVLFAAWADASEDMDMDSLPDSIEEQIGTDMTNADTDADGLLDYVEVINTRTGPLNADTNGDGIYDGEEDSDGDGISNAEEISIGTNPGNEDSDFDSINDKEEFEIGTDPIKADTDGDGAADGSEIENNSDPLVFNEFFIDVNSSQPISEDFPVSAKVEATVKASVLDTVAINPLTYTDNPLISENIPGYMNYAFELSAWGDIDSAELTFEYDEAKWQENDTFKPEIYKFNEETQSFDKLPNQKTEGNSVCATVDSCGTYILLNTYEYSVMSGEYVEAEEYAEILESEETAEGIVENVESEETVKESAKLQSASTNNSYSDYYAKYQDELRALVNDGDTTDANEDGIYDKYNIYIALGLIPTTIGDTPFVGIEFGENDDYDNDGLKNGEEIKIVVKNGLPQIEIISYPIFPDSDFDGWDDKEEIKYQGSDPLRKSYDASIVKKLLDDKNYAASLVVDDIESFFGGLAYYIVSYTATPMAGTIEDILTKEWITYLQKYYDGTNANSLGYSSGKYLKDYYLSAGQSALEATGSAIFQELFSLGTIETAIEHGSLNYLKSQKVSELSLYCAEMISEYFQKLAVDNYNMALYDYGETIKNIAKYLRNNYNVNIDVKIKYVEIIGGVVNFVINIFSINAIIENEKDELVDVLKISADISANLEAYSSSRQLFWYIYKNSEIKEARKAALDLYNALESKEAMLKQDVDFAWSTKNQQAGQISIYLLLGTALSAHPIVNILVSIVQSIATYDSVQNNKIIAIDALCDAVEYYLPLELDSVGKSFSPEKHEKTIITDRYLANIIQLRIVGEMYVNNYVPSQDNINTINRLLGYAADLNIPISSQLLAECRITKEPNVIINNVEGYLPVGLLSRPAGDVSGYAWGEVAFFEIITDEYHSNSRKLYLNPGFHIVRIESEHTKPCNYYLEVEDHKTYVLDFRLIPETEGSSKITGAFYNDQTGGGIYDVTVNVREGYNNNIGAIDKTFVTPSSGEYETSLPNGYYTFELIKEGFKTTYLNVAVYQNNQVVNGKMPFIFPEDIIRVEFDANGGSGAPAAIEETGSIKIPATEPTRNNYEFVGWSKTKSEIGYSAEYHKGQTYNFPKGTTTLYAVWKPNTFDVVFHANGGTFENAKSDTITMQKEYNRPFLMNPEVPVHSEKAFSGYWSLYEDGSDPKYEHGKSHSDIGDPSSDVKHLYAVWEGESQIELSQTSVSYAYNETDEVTVNVTCPGVCTVNTDYKFADPEPNPNHDFDWLSVESSGNTITIKPKRANYSAKTREASVCIKYGYETKIITVVQAACEEPAPTMTIKRGNTVITNGMNIGAYTTGQPVMEADIVSENVKLVTAHLRNASGGFSLQTCTSLDRIAFDISELPAGNYKIIVYASNSDTANDYWNQSPFENGSLEFYFSLVDSSEKISGNKDFASFAEAEKMISYPKKLDWSDVGTINYVEQYWPGGNDSYFYVDPDGYWESTSQASGRCTRAASSMALSYMGKTAFPKSFNPTAGPYAPYAESLGITTRGNDSESLGSAYSISLATFEQWYANYANDTVGKYSPIVLHMRYSGSIHAFAVFGRDKNNTDYYYIVDSGTGDHISKVKIVEVDGKIRIGEYIKKDGNKNSKYGSGYEMVGVWQYVNDSIEETKTYTVTYDANEGYGAPAAQTKIAGQTLVLSSAVPTKNGHEFIGWATSATATFAEYQPGESYTVDADVTLYAVWGECTNFVTVYLDANGGTGIPESATAYLDEFGDYYLDLSKINPTREGYTLIGWQLYINAYEFDFEGVADVYRVDETYALVPPQMDGVKTSLIAVWKNNSKPEPKITAKTVKVKQGEDAVVELCIENNDGLVISNVAFVDNSFPEGIDYSRYENYSESLIGDGKIFEIVFSVAETTEAGVYESTVALPDVTTGEGERYVFIDIPIEIEVEEKEKVNPMTIYFDANGGTGLPESIEIGLNSYNKYFCDLSNYAPEREGYTFIGWQLSYKSNGKDIVWHCYDADTSLGFSESHLKWELTFTAIWHNNQYSLPEITVKSFSAKPGEIAEVEFYVSNNQGFVTNNGFHEIEKYVNSWEGVSYEKSVSFPTTYTGERLIKLNFHISKDSVPGEYSAYVSFPDVKTSSEEKYIFRMIPFTITVEEPGLGLNSGFVSEEDDYTYETLAYGKCAITGYTGDDENIIIPGEIDGYSVSEIGYDAFKGNSILKRVMFPMYIELGVNAFIDCPNLRSVYFCGDASFYWSSDNQQSFKSNVILYYNESHKWEEIYQSGTFEKYNGYNVFPWSGPDFKTHKLEYDTNGGYSSVEGFYEIEGMPVTIGEYGSEAYPQPSRNGFIFKGWATTYNANEAEYLPGDGFTLDKDMTLYAVWEVDENSAVCDVEDYTYNIINDSYCEITGYTGSDEVIRIPSEIDGYSVKSIGDGAFNYNHDFSDFAGIIIPDTVEIIGNEAFSALYSLQKIVLPQNLKEIKDYAFSGCSSIREIILPDGLEKMGESIFSGCYSLNSITIPKGITTIEPSTFSECSSLKTVCLPDGLKVIKKYAFSECESLVSIDIPDTVTTIYDGAFYKCINLEEFGYPSGLLEIKTDSEYGYPYGLFYGCSKLKNIVIPEGVTTLPAYVFNNSEGLESISLPDGLTEIGEKAFYECTNLKSIDLPDSVTTIDNCAFYDCKNLSHFGYPKGLKNVEWEVFSGCTSLTQIEIPEGVVKIPDNTFEFCESLKTVVFPESLREIGKDAFWNCGFEKLDLPEGLEIINEGAFSWCASLESVYLPDSVTTLGECAFGWCSNLVSARLSSNFTTLLYTLDEDIEGDTPDGPFAGCSRLETVTIPEGITNIPAYMFAYCGGLKTIAFPESLEEIGDNAFEGCDQLADIDFSEGLLKIGSYAFAHCESLNFVDFPESVTTIGAYAFGWCGCLSEIEYPKNLEVIIGYENEWGGYNISSPFWGCNNLKTVIIPEGTEKIPDSAFSWVESIENVTFPKSLKEIGNFAFEGTGIKSIVFPGYIESIGSLAFNNCYNLTDVVFESYCSFISNSFTDCENLKSVYFSSDAPSVFEVTEDEWGTTSFDPDIVTLYYIEGMDGWEPIENGKWNGYNVAVWEKDKEFSYGDINLDGFVDVKDVYTARLIAAKLIKPTEQQLVIGDVDCDGRITAIDANLIRKYAAKIINSLPI